MRQFKLFIVMIIASVTGQWHKITLELSMQSGATPPSREKNVLTANYMREAFESKNYDVAAEHLKKLLESCPAASEAIYARGTAIYRARIARAKSLR